MQTVFRTSQRMGVFFVLWILTGIAFGQDPQSTYEELHKPDSPRFRSAQECGRCHSGIYRVWSNSMHAMSATDPVFLRSLSAATRNYGEQQRKFCLSCHSPTTQITSDTALNDPLSREGVTCDFCHSVTSVLPGSPQNVFRVQLGNTKFGPFENMKPISDLEFQFSALHQSSTLCQGCHELKSPLGIAVLDTYSEWKQSSYERNGVVCQNCHMPQTIDVPSVDPQFRPVSPPAHAHEFLGGHSQIRLERAASLSINCEPEAGKILVDAFVTNEEAGHSLPTGIPTRKMVLTVSLKDSAGKVLEARTLEYRKTVLDKQGAVLEQPERIFLEAAAIGSDNRIKPRETRHETFEFTNIEGKGPFIIAADLRYHFQSADPAVLTAPMVSVVNTLTLPAAPGSLPWLVLFGLTLMLAAVLWIVLASISRSRGR